MDDVLRHTVDGAQLVGRMEPRGDLGADVRSEGERKAPAVGGHPPNERRGRLPFQILHHDVVVVLLLSELLDVYDVGMTNPRSDARFVEKHLDERPLTSEVGQNALDHDWPLEPGRTRAAADEDLGHSPRGDATHDVIRADSAW